MESGIDVPVAMTGFISRMPQSPFCTDGSTHLLHTPTGALRLKAKSREAEEALRTVENGDAEVTVVGDQQWTPECPCIEVHFLAHTEQFVKLLDERLLPWPW